MGSLKDFTFHRRIISFNGVAAPYEYEGWGTYTTGPVRQGLTANLAQAWGALGDGDEWVFHVEEDFVIAPNAPLTDMIATLNTYRYLANMVLVRQPWNQQERKANGLLKANRPFLTPRDGGRWQEHDRGFWLNPMIAHSSLLRTLKPGVEQELTKQCTARRLRFGWWGAVDDDPRCIHVGASGGMNSPGWLP